MFEKFSATARRVVVLAQEEARMLNHDYICTEHVLLGALHNGTGVGAKILTDLCVDVEMARAAVVEIIGHGYSAPSGHIPFTPRAREVLEQAMKEALALESGSVTEDHILLGTLRGASKGSVTSQVLDQLGASAAGVADQLEGRLKDQSPTEEDAGTPVAEAIAAFQRTLRLELDIPYPELKAAMTEALRAAQLAAVGLTRAA